MGDAGAGPSLIASPRKSSPSDKPPRLTLSCKSCRRKKIKCDRLRPCQACAASGRPQNCQYDVNEETQMHILQGEEIKRLRRKVKRLEVQVASSPEDDSSSSPSRQIPNESNHSGEQDARQTLTIGIPPFMPRPNASPSSDSAPSLARFATRFTMSGNGSDRRWLAGISEEEAFSPGSLVGQAMGALAMAFCAQEDDIPGLLDIAHKAYTNVLSTLCSELANSQEPAALEHLCTTVVLSLLELLVWQDYNSWLIHLAGADNLLQLCGPQVFEDGIAGGVFRFHRFFGLTYSLLLRWPNFLSELTWKTIPWKRAYPNKNLQDLLLDIIIDVPNLLHETDEILRDDQDAYHRPRTPLSVLSQSLFTVLMELDDWERRWVMTYPGVSSFASQPYQGFARFSIPLLDATLSKSASLFYAARLMINGALLSLGELCPDDLNWLVHGLCSHTELQLLQAVNDLDLFEILLPIKLASLEALLDQAQEGRIAGVIQTAQAGFERSCATMDIIELQSMARALIRPSPQDGDSGQIGEMRYHV